MLPCSKSRSFLSDNRDIWSNFLQWSMLSYFGMLLWNDKFKNVSVSLFLHVQLLHYNLFCGFTNCPGDNKSWILKLHKSQPMLYSTVVSRPKAFLLTSDHWTLHCSTGFMSDIQLHDQIYINYVWVLCDCFFLNQKCSYFMWYDE